MAIVAEAHRLCRIMFEMLRHQSDFDVAKLGVERGPLRAQDRSRLPAQGEQPVSTGVEISKTKVNRAQDRTGDPGSRAVSAPSTSWRARCWPA
jgi:hypothetical protein